MPSQTKKMRRSLHERSWSSRRAAYDGGRGGVRDEADGLKKEEAGEEALGSCDLEDTPSERRRRIGGETRMIGEGEEASCYA